MKNHKLTILVVLLAAVAAFAVSRPFSGTINTPSIATWVDGANNEIAPYVTLGGDNLLYLDSTTGYIWRVKDVLTSPAADGQSLQGIYFTTANCTGTPYLLMPAWTLPKLVQTAGASGTYYVGGSPAGLAINSQLLSGNCFPASYGSTDFYTSAGPLTPPTLTGAPWHLEAR